MRIWIKGSGFRVESSALDGATLTVTYTHPKGAGRAAIRKVTAAVVEVYPAARLRVERREVDTIPMDPVENRTGPHGRSIATFRVPVDR
jgi:hypothetical protein